MRITQLTTFNSFQRYLNDNRETLAKYQQQVSTRKRVTKASDDNIAFTTSRLLDNSIRKNEQYQDNISSGLTKTRAAEDALNGVLDVLVDFKTTAINAASDTSSKDVRKNLADQVAGLKKKIIDLGNTEFNNVHLFAGTKTDEAPFSIDDTAAGGVRYNGNDKNIKSQISDTSRANISVTGSDLRDTGSGDLFEIMQNVEDALSANDRSTIHDNIDNIGNAIDHVTNVTSVLGSNVNRMKFLNQQFKGQAIDQKGEVSRLVDTDLADAISNVQKYETSYQAALSVHSRIIQTSLLNYL